MNSSVLCACRSNLQKVTCLPSERIRTQSSIKVSELIFFVLADADERVFEFLNIADLATRFTIWFPIPSKRADDVRSVLELI